MAKPRRISKPRHTKAPPGPVALLRTSERSVLNRCRFQHHLTYTRQLKPKLEAPPLRFGTLIHKALELYYDPAKAKNRRPKPAATFERLYREDFERTTRELPDWRDDNDVWHSHLELGISMLDGYVEKWTDQDDEYITLAVEQTFQYPIILPAHLAVEEDERNDEAPTTYVGTLDRILYHQTSKRLLFGDYKTTKTDPTKTKYLALDEQAGAYWAIAPPWLRERAPAALRAAIRARVQELPPAVRKRVLTPEGDLRFQGILYDFLKKSLPDERPVNKDGYALNKDRTVSKQQPGPLYAREVVLRDEHDRAKVIERIYEDAVEIGRIRSGEMSHKKSPDKFHCQFCAFTDQCELEETGSDWKSYERATTRSWDPYAAHEIEDDEHN